MAIRVGDLVIDDDQRVMWRGETVPLRPAERRLLIRLASATDRVHTRDELLAEVGASTSRAVDVHMARLRRALRGAAGALLTIRRVGYRLDPERL